MARTPGVPLKIAVAAVNVGFIVAALALPEVGWLALLAAAVWTVHACFALAALFLAPMRGESRLWAVQVLLVGTVSLVHLLRTSPSDHRSPR